MLIGGKSATEALTQEYLGHSTHLVYLAPMWREYLDFDTYARGKGSTLANLTLTGKGLLLGPFA